MNTAFEKVTSGVIVTKVTSPLTDKGSALDSINLSAKSIALPSMENAACTSVSISCDSVPVLNLPRITSIVDSLTCVTSHISSSITA